MYHLVKAVLAGLVEDWYSANLSGNELPGVPG